MSHKLLLPRKSLLNDNCDMLKNKNKNKYESALVESFSKIKKLKDLQKAKNDEKILDAEFYNKFYKDVYCIDYNLFIDNYKNLLFKDSEEQSIPVNVVVNYFQAEGGHRKGTDHWEDYYWVVLSVFAEANTQLDEKVYTIEETISLINNGKILAYNWRTGKKATQEECHKQVSGVNLSELFFNSQKEYGIYQDFSKLPHYSQSYGIVRNTLTTEQISNDLNVFIKDFEEQVKKVLEKNENEKTISIKRHFTNRLKQNEDMISLSNNALESLNSL